MISLDTRHAPLFIVRWIGEIENDGLDRYVRVHERLLEAEAEHALLVDVAEASITAAGTGELIELSSWMQRRSDTLTRLCRAVAVVVGNQRVREALAHFGEFRPVGVRAEIFGEPIAAGDWLRPLFDGLDAAAATASLGEESSSPETLRTPGRAGSEGEALEAWSPYTNGDSGETTPH